MPNPSALTPIQSTQPTLRDWLLTRLFRDRGISEEFYNRLMGLCNFDYPMTPSLRSQVESTFGFEMVGVIEQYVDREKPVLNRGLRDSIRRVIPDLYYLEFIRLFDCSCCPPIIQEVADIADAVDGTVEGQLTVERYIDGVGNQHIHFYTWDGANWTQNFDSSSKATGGLFDAYSFSVSNGNWEFSVDGGLTWQSSDYDFDPDVPSFSVWFRNTVNNCIYSGGDLSFPLQIFCVESFTIDNSDPLFGFGTINGVDASDLGAVAASYANWEGYGQSIFLDLTSSPGLITIFRDSSTAPFNNLGTYIPFGGGDNVIFAPTGLACSRGCNVAVFTVVDLATDSFTGVEFDGISYDITFDSPLIDPVASASAYQSGLATAGITEPTATVDVALNGNEVTLTICSVRVLTGGAWSDNPVTHSGTFTFSQI